MNSLFQQLSKHSIGQNPVMQMYQIVKSAQNPNAVMQQLINQTPYMQELMKYVQSNGGDPKTAFYNLAKQKGVNPDDIISMLR